MSGPVSSADTPAEPVADVAAPPCFETLEGRQAQVGRMTVTRLLPKRARRTIGAWCFVDHFGPARSADATIQIGPHPHIGLHTVTWLLEGEVVHRDGLGSEQPITPGQLNLMTAGRGIAHAEEDPARLPEHVHGLQLWVAQPDVTRFGDPAFEHHAALPQVTLDGAEVTVLVGDVDGTHSPARADTPLVGADVAVRGDALLPLDPAFEHGVVPVDGDVRVGDRLVAPGTLAYVGVGRDELPLSGDGRVLVLGGEPFEAPVLMWCNFVARSRDEVDDAIRSCNERDGRFGEVDSRLARIAAPPRV